jgi:hypothetical protein
LGAKMAKETLSDVQAVYQLEQSNGSWLDASKDAYDSTEEERRRIVYLAAPPIDKEAAEKLIQAYG